MIATVDPKTNSEKLNSISTETEKSLEVKSTPTKNSPSIQDVLSGKIDPTTKSRYVIKKGMKGKSIYYIQNLLKNLGYSEMLTNFKDKKNPTDSDFGENTETSIYVFQGDNGIKETGIVDQVTLNSLIKKSNENNKNENNKNEK